MRSSRFSVKLLRYILPVLLLLSIAFLLGQNQLSARASPAAAITTVTFRSIGKYDGWTDESSEFSGVGVMSHNTYDYFVVGDGPADEQYRGIVSFNTSSLPDRISIFSVKLKVKYAGRSGTLPFFTHGGLFADVKTPAFNGSKGWGLSAIEILPGDFEAPATQELVAQFGNVPKNGWYTASIPGKYISRTRTTQFRLRFLKDDNDDMSSDYIEFYQGDCPDRAKHPRLIITYVK